MSDAPSASSAPAPEPSAPPPSAVPDSASDACTLEPPAGALADRLTSTLDPMVAAVDDGIRLALESQAALSQQLDRVAGEIQTFLSVSELPSFSPHAARLADVRKRLGSTSGTLAQVQARLQRIEALADRLQDEEHATLRRGPPARATAPRS